MFLIINSNERIECSRAEKGPNYIKLFDGNENLIMTFEGIPDFSKFKLEKGAFSCPDVDEITQLKLAISDLAELMEAKND